MTETVLAVPLPVTAGIAQRPPWPIAFLAAGLFLLAAGAFAWRVWRSPFEFPLSFWRVLNDLYCRWWFGLRREGDCPVPVRGPVIVAANHTCSIDPLLLIGTMPRGFVSFLIAREFYAIPIFGRLVRFIECIPVNRDGRDVIATRAALRHLREGKGIGIFPEGRIARPGEILNPKPGAAMLALRSRATVVPAYIRGTRYSESVAWPFFCPQRARVRYGRPIDLSPYYGRHRDPAVVDEVARLIMRRIRELAGTDLDGKPGAGRRTPSSTR